MPIIYITILTALSALFYRMGGMGDSGRQMFPGVPKWMFNTKTRDFGCPLVCFLGMLAIGISAPWWIHFICFGLLFASLTTYWDSVPFNKGRDNFWMHGFIAGIAYFPYAITTGDWIPFIIRALALALIMGGVSAASKNDNVEEYSRGGSLAATLAVYLF